MKEVQKPDHLSLNKIISQLRDGQFVIPDFQRDFEWKPWDITELMRSVFMDYYIGSLLLWKGKKTTFDALSCEVIYGFESTTDQNPWNFGNGKPDYIVLDGQQRLTALYYTFIAPDVPLPNRASRAVYFIHVDKFMNEEYDEAFQYDWLSKRFSRTLDNPEVQYEEHIFPLSIIGKEGWDLPDWVRGYEKFWSDKAKAAEQADDQEETLVANDHAKNAAAFGNHLKEITQDYQIVYIELDKDLEVEKVCDIFTQINSRGIRLDVFDLINALLKPKGLQLKHMWRDAITRLNFVDTGKMNVYILQVMSILTQSYCSPKYLYYLLPGEKKQVRNSDGTKEKKILVPDTQTFQKKWDHAVNAIEKAIKLLRHPQEFGVSSSKYLPYVSILPAFSAIQSLIKDLPVSLQLEAQRKFRHWYWASVFTNRYSGAVESTTSRDYTDMQIWFNDDDVSPPLLLDFETRFRNLDLKKEVRRGTSGYNGVFNLLVLNGSRDWVSGTIPLSGDLDDHHIIPASWGQKYIGGNRINTILNRTPLSAQTNRTIINDRLPNEYLPEMIKSNGREEVLVMLQPHFITPKALDILLREPFKPEDFEAFITERQKTIQNAIEDLLIKDRLDLSPKLRDLDKQLEQIELSLRQLIVEYLDDDLSKLPQHIRKKADGRIQGAAKKNPGFDLEKHQTFIGLLEYFDLRELQDTMVSKSLWTMFQPIFKNKETLIIKFNQMAELRNSIRHSRTVGDVVQKEGEAAIIWFKDTLGIQ